MFSRGIDKQHRAVPGWPKGLSVIYNGQNFIKIGSFFPEVLFYQFIFLKKSHLKYFSYNVIKKIMMFKGQKVEFFEIKFNFLRSLVIQISQNFHKILLSTNLSQMHKNN